jgi:adenylate cyclase
MEKLSRLLTGTYAVVAIAFLFLALKFYNPLPVQILQLKTFDWLITSLGEKQSDDIVIVEFDEKTVEKFGQWPFDRRDIAGVIQQLRENGAGVIVAPILFGEKDRAGGDQNFIDTIKDNGVVIAQTATTQNNRPDAARRGFAAIGGDPSVYAFTWRGAIPPLPDIAVSADGVGVVATIPERDGVVRRLPMLVNIGGSLYPSLVLEAIRVAADDISYQVKVTDAGIEAVRIPKFKTIATDPNGRIWLSWNTSFSKISATAIDKTVENKIVILGLAVEGVGGIIATPNGEQWAHTLQAQALQTVADGTSIQRLAYADFIEVIYLIIALFIIIVLVPRASIKWTVPIYFAYSGGIAYSSYYMFQTQLQLWDPSYALFAGTFVYGQLVFNNFVREFRLKQEIKKQFAGYASPTVVRLLQENPDLIKRGTKREVSILFSDLRGFTPLGESFGDDVAGLTKIMNGYMDAITQPVLDADGMIIKYIGDASMHIHNAPIEDLSHPATAVRTGLKMLKAVDKFNEEVIVPQGRPPVGMGAGINTGLGYIGEMGSTARHSYDVLGDAVSTAARIESKCKEYGCLLLVGGATVDQCRDDFFFLKIDDLAVKGKTVGVEIYTVLDDVTDAYRSAKIKHEEMHRLYRAQKFADAIKMCQLLKPEFNSKMANYYDMWIERCEFQKTQDLPKDWSGTFVATTK